MENANRFLSDPSAKLGVQRAHSRYAECYPANFPNYTSIPVSESNAFLLQEMIAFSPFAQVHCLHC